MISNQILDFYDDKKKSVFEKIASLIPKDLYEQNISDNIDPENYALRVLTKHGSILCKFPVDSILNTTLSNLYFSETHNQIPPQAQSITAHFIKEACAKFGVKAADQVIKLAAPAVTNFFDESKSFTKKFQKVAFDSTRDDSVAYALPGLKKYAMPDETYLRKAERYFEENYRQFEPTTRVEYSENLIKRAADLGVETKAEIIKKYASKQYSKKVSQHLKAREPLCKEASHLNVLKKMHGFIEKTAAFEFAQALHEFDKKTGMERYYDSRIKDPFLSVLDIDIKPDFSYIEKNSGLKLDAKSLKSSFEKNAQKIEEHFGKALVDGLNNNGIEAFEALPDDTKDILAKIAIGHI